MGQFSRPSSRLTIQYSTQFYRLTPEERGCPAAKAWLDVSLRNPAARIRTHQSRVASRVGVTAADASIFFGHTEAEVVERTATDDAWQITVRVPADPKGEIPVYAVAAGELSNPVNVYVR